MASRTSSQAVKDVAVTVDGGTQDERTQEESRSCSAGCKWFFYLLFGSLFLLAFVKSPFKKFGMNPDLDFSLLFLGAVLALGIVLKLGCGPRANPEEQDFDAIIMEVAQTVCQESEMEDGLLEPLLQMRQSPLCNQIYHVDDRQFGISHKKSGEVVVEGSNAASVQRLSFSRSKTGHGFSIQGSRSSASKSNTFIILKGFVSDRTKKGYWEESCQGVRRVVTGQFGDNFASFSGEWLATNGTRGSLLNSKEATTIVEYAVPIEDSGLASRAIAESDS